MYKYQYVSRAEVFIKDGDDFIAALEIRGHDWVDVNNNERHREELREQPVFRGLLGPMYGGIDPKTGATIIRYETQEIYDLLSM